MWLGAIAIGALAIGCSVRDAVVGSAAPAAAAVIPEARTPADRREILRQAVDLYGRQDEDGAEPLFENTARNDPLFGDYALRHLARIREARGDRTGAVAFWQELLDHHFLTIWRAEAALALARAREHEGNLREAERWVEEAKAAFVADPSIEAEALWVSSRLARAQGRMDDARELAVAVRTRFPGSPESLAARDEAWAEREVAALSRPGTAHDEAARLLVEGEPRRALELVRNALGRFPGSEFAAALGLLEARALQASGERAAAEDALEALRRRYPRRREAADALYRLASLAWNRDEDQEARRRFELYVRTYPRGDKASESLYAVGRIDQEAGRWSRAAEAYSRLMHRYPKSDLASEAGWRVGWCHYLAGNPTRAARAFAAAQRKPGAEQAAALYWHARSTEKIGGAAGPVYAELLQRFPDSYYALLVERRTGRPEGAGFVPSPQDTSTAAPVDAADPHFRRFLELEQMNLDPFARLELAAFERRHADVPATTLLGSWLRVDGYRQAIRGAAARDGCKPESSLLSYCFPLGFWTIIARESRDNALDPYLVLSLIRQESLFDPRAISPANARGLMQLLPATAERTQRSRGRDVPAITELFDPERNISIGVAHLRELLDRYQGRIPLALAAYNAGAGAVEKWLARYPSSEDDEFVDRISYRETRDYVKRVLRNRRIYRVLYENR